MKTKPIVIGAVLLLVLLFIALPLTVARHPPHEITVRHVASVRLENIATMTFELKNHTANPYVLASFEVQVRSGNGWTKFQGFDGSTMRPIPIHAMGLTSHTCNVTNLPAGSVVRFKIRPQKTLMGVNGFLRRAELNLKKQGRGVSLNPNDRNSKVFGLPTEVVSEEWVETGE